MAACSCCCWKKKPAADHSVNSRTPSPPDIETISTNPSTDSPDQLQIVSSPQPSSTTTPPTLQEVTSSFEKIDITSRADDFIAAIKETLERQTAEKHTQDTPTTSSSHIERNSWDSFIQSGRKFLKFLNDYTEKIKIDSKDSFFQSGEAAKIVGDILKQIGDVHWAVAGLSIVGYLVSKCAKASSNRTECLDLLQEMLVLVSHIKDLNTLIKEEKEKSENAFQYIIEGSICCASQLDSRNFFSFLKSSVNSQTLGAIRSKISSLKPIAVPLSRQGYPSNTVGIKDQLEEVNKLLNMENTEDCSSIFVVIWGQGGTGKTTLAEAVVSTVDRNCYNYVRIELDLVSEKNNYIEMQQRILKDAFPSYEGGRKVRLRDDADGRDHLREAFKSEANKPVFLFIDNALHRKDLKKILPEDLRGLPQRSRILITTRNLGVTEVLEDRGLRRRSYLVKELSANHALQILCDDPAIRDGIKDYLEEIAKLCNGIPLALKIVGAHLRKQRYKVDRCRRLLEASKEEEKIKEVNLSNNLFDFVYSSLDQSTKEAFLDICCLFHKDYSRRYVEYIVGAEEVAVLVDAALITTVMAEDEEMMSVNNIILSIGRRMSRSSRIMDVHSWIEAEKDEASLKGIKGICLEYGACTLEKRHLHQMKDTLRILIWMGSIDVRATDEVTLPELRCIITDGDISGLNVETLDKLAFLKCEKLPTKQSGHLKLPESLRRIEATRQPVETQDLSKIVPNSSLEELYLYFSQPSESSDKEKDNSEYVFNTFLHALNNLKHLKVENCDSICNLPGQLCRLPQLSTLSMKNCSKLECLPELFGQLITLRELDLSWCASLEVLPLTFGKLTNLKKLDLSMCISLKEVPPSFSDLQSLDYLNLKGCVGLELDIRQMDNIKIVKKSEESLLHKGLF